MSRDEIVFAALHFIFWWEGGGRLTYTNAQDALFCNGYCYFCLIFLLTSFSPNYWYCSTNHSISHSSH